MEAKDKAKELVNRLLIVSDPLHKYPMCFDTAKACALICVDEMITLLWNQEGATKGNYMIIEYWEVVKQEIKLL